MFVGDVRCATTGSGVSWKLSAGSAFSDGPAKASKYLQVRRAIARRNRASAGARGSSAVGGGRLIHRATVILHRQPDGSSVIRHRASDALPDPPGRVRRELEAAAILKPIDRLHQADVAFLDQIEQRKAAIQIALGD